MNFWVFELLEFWMPPSLAEAAKEDPVGFKCEKQILNITEISFVEQVRCYNTTEQVCSMVNIDQINVLSISSDKVWMLNVEFWNCIFVLIFLYIIFFSMYYFFK